jgi:hypothetical protein
MQSFLYDLFSGYWTDNKTEALIVCKCGQEITNQLNNWLHGAESIFRSNQSLSFWRISQHSMEHEGSIPCSQQPSTCTYPEQILSKKSIPRTSATLRNKIIFYGEELLAPRPTPSWRPTPCRLPATAYSVYLQLPSISGGHLLYPQPEDAPCRGENGPTERVNVSKIWM